MVRVVFTGWKPGFNGIEFIKIIKRHTGQSLAPAKRIMDQTLEGAMPSVEVESTADAEALVRDAMEVLAECRIYAGVCAPNSQTNDKHEHSFPSNSSPRRGQPMPLDHPKHPRSPQTERNPAGSTTRRTAFGRCLRVRRRSMRSTRRGTSRCARRTAIRTSGRTCGRSTRTGRRNWARWSTTT